MTSELVALVKQAESLFLVPYLCPAGYPTIGWGHRIPSMSHPPITEADAEVLLALDLGIAERGAILLAPSLLIEARRLAALTDLVYNVGRDALDGVNPMDLTDDSGVVQYLRAGIYIGALAWMEAAGRFRQWNKARVNGVLTPLAGLTHRREIGARWIEEGG